MSVKDRVAVVSSAASTISTGYALYRTGRDFWHSRDVNKTYLVSVNERDSLYFAAQEWAMRILEPVDQKNLTVTYGREKNQVKYSGTESHVIYLGGHKVIFYVSVPDDAIKGNDATSSAINKQMRPSTMNFQAETFEGKEEILKLLNKLRVELNSMNFPPYIFTHRGGEYFESLCVIPPRPMGSLVLKEGQLERILADLDQFVAAKERYENLGMPWHRGYLFYGPPGTGKSTIPKALAHYLNRHLYYLPIGDIDKDTTFSNCVGAVKDNILLMEDIDVFGATTSSRNTKKDTVSLSGILNGLDGATTPHGLITIMTTNNKDDLDPALIRSGRVDVMEEFGYADEYQLGRFYENFYGEPLPKEIEFGDAKVSPSQITEIFKTQEKPAKALKAVEKLIRT